MIAECENRFSSILNYVSKEVSNRLPDEQKRVVAVASLALAAVSAVFFAARSLIAAYFKEKKDRKIEQQLLTILQKPGEIAGYRDLAALVGEAPFTTLEGQKTTFFDFFLDAKATLSQQADWFCLAGEYLKEEQTIDRSDGEEPLTKRFCYQKAIALNPQDARAFFRLAQTLKGEETIEIGGDHKTRKQLLDQMIEIEQGRLKESPFLEELLTFNLDIKQKVFQHLRGSVSHLTPIRLSRGGQISLHDILIWLIEHDNSVPKNYYLLSLLLVPKSTVNLGVLGVFDKKALLFTALQLYRDHTCRDYLETLYAYAKLFGKDETIQLPRGLKSTVQEVYKNILAKDPTFVDAYVALANTLSNKADEVEIRSGNDSAFYTKVALFLKALEQNPYHMPALIALGKAAEPDQRFTINHVTITGTELKKHEV